MNFPAQVHDFVLHKIETLLMGQILFCKYRRVGSLVKDVICTAEALEFVGTNWPVWSITRAIRGVMCKESRLHYLPMGSAWQVRES